MFEFIDYIKNPTVISRSVSNRVNIIILFVLYIFGALFLAMIASVICKIFSIEHSMHTLSLRLMLIAIFVAPIYEEFLFRLLLRPSTKNYILFVATVFILTIISFLYGTIIFFSILLGVLLLSLVMYFMGDRSRNYIFNKINFKYSFYFSTLFFGLMHLSNFTGNAYIISLFAILLVGPQILLGLILGYIRMRFGLIFSIIFHAVVNLSVLFSLIY